jgi:hypothetical protein
MLLPAQDVAAENGALLEHGHSRRIKWDDGREKPEAA